MRSITFQETTVTPGATVDEGAFGQKQLPGATTVATKTWTFQDADYAALTGGPAAPETPAEMAANHSLQDISSALQIKISTPSA